MIDLETIKTRLSGGAYGGIDAQLYAPEDVRDLVAEVERLQLRAEAMDTRDGVIDSLHRKDARAQGDDLAVEFMQKFPTAIVDRNHLGAWFHAAMQIGADMVEGGRP